MLPRETILGHYRLLQRIGVGGMGEVYLAEDTRIARQVAIKIVREEQQPYPDSATAQESSRLFRREMKAIAMLDHRNILNLIDFGEETIEGMPITYMIMPFRKEGSLNEWLQRYKPNELLSLDLVDYILSQAADALQHAHDHHIIHQDVKPSNFLIREHTNNPGRPDLLLTDFGVAKLTNATATASQHVRGTPTFMPPEQWESQPAPATDQYALAIMAYLLLTGRTPFVGRMEQVMRQHLMTPPQPPSTYNSQISRAIDAVILRALAKQPEERFPSIADFARAFHHAIQYPGDLRTTLTISRAEATTGVERSITLPGGRSVSINVPQHAQDGQELRVENQGDPYYESGPRGPLLLKLAVPSVETTPVSKDEKESVLPTVSSPLEPTVYAGQRQSDQLLPTIAVPATSPLEPTVPAINEKPDSQKPVIPSSPLASSPPGLPSRPQSLPDKRARKPVVLVLSLASVVILIIVGILGLAHLGSVNTDNANATATTSAANTTGTANAFATGNAQAVATVNGIATGDAQTVEAGNAFNRANADPYGAGGTIFGTSSLTHKEGWFDPLVGFGCQFMSDGLHVINTTCDGDSRGPTFDNFVFEVKMTINQGDCGGMDLRLTFQEGYRFYVCSNGTYRFAIEKADGSEGVLTSGGNSGITSGQNTIAVVANGSNFTLYLNHIQLGSVSDGTYSSGVIGLVAISMNNNATEVTYTDARLWTL